MCAYSVLFKINLSYKSTCHGLRIVSLLRHTVTLEMKVWCKNGGVSRHKEHDSLWQSYFQQCPSAQERGIITVWSDFIYFLFSSLWSIQEVFADLQMIVVISEQILLSEISPGKYWCIFRKRDIILTITFLLRNSFHSKMPQAFMKLIVQLHAS